MPIKNNFSNSNDKTREVESIHRATGSRILRRASRQPYWILTACRGIHLFLFLKHIFIAFETEFNLKNSIDFLTSYSKQV